MLVRAMRVVVALGTVTTSLAMVAAQEAPDSDDNDSAPVLAASATHTVAEGQTVVATVIATDADGDTITYELTGGADQDDFAIGAASGELTFNTAPDFENPTDADGNNVYVVVVTATAGGQAVTQTVTVRVTNVDDNAPVFAEGSVNHTVAENFTTSAIVTTVTATDADGDDITIEPSSIIVYPITYTLTGADQSSFTIDPFARLRFNTVPDFENPGDADGNNVYVVVVTATSGTRTASQTVTVTVTNVDDNAPVFTSTAAHNVAEGQTTVTTVTATDDDGDTITYKLTGLERSSFTIDANTGELRFRTAPDFKNPGDTDGNNVYAVVVTATAGGQSTNQAVTVTVTNVNALVLAATAAHNVVEGQTAVTTVTATDDDGDTITYKLTGLDRLSFAIAPNTGELRFRTAPDFKNPEDADGNNVYVFVVTATVGTLTASQTVTVTVTNENAPVFTSTAAHNVAEGQTAVATVIATDGDGDTITYTLTGGADRSSFTIDAASGVLAFKTAPDFENPTDAGGNNVYVVVVTATAGGEIASQTVTVTVTNENALVLAGTAAHSVVEGQTAVTTVIATDDDGDTITYELTGGADRSSFTIDAASGVLAFNTAPDFENPGDAGGNNVYVVVVTATAGGEIAFQTVTVTVTNVDDNAPVLASTAAHNVAEGQTVVATVIATDGDGDTITYELTGGADQGDFEIGAASGVLAFNTGPDFENPGSADNSNVYVVVVAATAGGQAVAQVVTVTVTNVDDNAPVLAATAAHTVAEGQTVVATVIATDGDGDTITYTLTGADQDDFEITASGVLAFNTAPDFENPSDAGGNNVYVVVVTATAGTRTAFQTVTVTVTNVNDNAPVFAEGSAAHNVAEGQTVVATVIATDGDGDTITYTLTGGADRSSFTIDAASGVLAFNTAPDFENPGSADNSNVYVVVVTATAGGQAVTQVVTVTVTNVDDNAPVFAEGSAAHNVAEGQTVVAIVIATDGDGDTITYTLTGADQDDFEITASGVLAFNTAPDFENPGDAGGNNVYVVVVAATAGTRTAFQTVTVTVTNVDDNAPVLAGTAAHSVVEGQTAVATVIAIDGDGDTITYTLTGGADRSSFTIDAASGVLAFRTAPDFENPGSADNSNIYVLEVTATAGGQAVTQVVTVTVTNVDDNAPVFAEGSAAHTVAEGQTAVATVIATDGDGDTITYTLTGADQDDFEITDTGVLAFNTAPDFENPSDAGGNNVYVVVVTATAGTRTAFQTVTVTVTNVNDNTPVLASTAAHNVAEGQTVVATVIATDGDGDTITYELTSGSDQGDFEITDTGELTFNTAPDFENPSDADGNNVYVVVVTATAGGEIASQTVTVTVTNENAPVFAAATATATYSVAEGQTVVATVIAIDDDGDTITYELTGGADRSSFTIDAASGVLAFNTAPDFENPGDAGGNNVYVVVVAATAGGEIAFQTVTVTVTNVDDNAPVFAAGSAAHTVAEGQTVVATVIAIDGDGDTITYTLTGGADRSSFTIDADTGELTFNTAPDFENPGSADNSNIYVLEVTATAGGQAVTQVVTVTVTNVDDNAPVFAEGSAAHTVAEGQTVVATVIATDGDGDTITYTLTGADQDDFEITDTGDLAFNTAPDFENPTDAGGNNVYVVVVTATAGTRTAFQTVTVTVTNVNDNTPVLASTAAHNVAEGQTVVTTVIATDGDGDTITYELTGGADRSSFTIDAASGVLAFNTAPDFENPGDAGGNNVYVVVVAATAGGQAVTQAVTVTVTNVDDNAPVFAAGSAAHNVAEGQTVVATVIATDGDGDTITYTLTGADQDDFEITDTGELAFNTAPDFENPTDAGGNNVYVVVVTATAGTRTAFQTVTVTVTNVNENAPVLAGSAAHNVAEGQTVVTTVIATDGDGDTITYELTGGADQGDFEIGAASGVLAFNTGPDFENPGSADNSNVYVVVVTATAGGQAVTQVVTVTVTNVDDNAPVFAASTATYSVAEGQTVVATVIATDGDGDTITYTLTGADQDDFEISDTGDLRFNTAPDFENPSDADGNNVYVVVVTATAGGQAVTQAVTVTVTNENAPVFAAGTATYSVAEGQTVVTTVIATDGDGDTITYELTSGADRSSFTINADTGELAFNTAPDFENPSDADGNNVYVVVVTATAGGETASQTVTVTVTNENAPVFAAATATYSVAEGQTAIATVIAIDGDGDTITYELTSGADRSSFTINADTGELAFNTAPDFENPTDTGGNNVYVVVVTATAGGGEIASQTVTVTVTNVNDNSPVLAGTAAHTVAEGQTVVTTVIAIDGDGDTITYELTSGADRSSFTINADTGELAFNTAPDFENPTDIDAAAGELTFNTAPDFENPSDAGGNNVYVVVVAATAGGQAVTQVVTVTVTNVDDNAPVFAEGSAAHNVAEGQTVVDTVIATDGDGDTITYTLTGVDQDDFEITDTGLLAFNTAPDFENPSDAGGNNVYVVVVTATSGTRTAFQTVTVTVTNVNDNTPVLASSAAHNVAEGQTAVATVIATDGDGDTITYTLTGGSDQGDFEITDTGELAFNTAPDFENPGSADNSNVYVVVVTATAGGQAVTQAVTVTVTNVDDNAPVFAASTATYSVAEGQTVVATVIATDGDGDTITYTLTGADQDDFAIGAASGVLAFNTAPDFENPGSAGGNNVYVVVVAATAGTRTAFQTVTVTVTNVNDNAPVLAGTAAHNVAEGQTVVATVIATDGDGDTITYTLTGGADQDDFEITDTGVLAFNTAPDFENPTDAGGNNVYVVVVTATAGGEIASQTVTVTVTNVDDNAPVLAGSAAHSVAEGQTVVATVIAIDGDGDTITYTLTGADQDDFEITDTGDLAFNTAPDFENPGSAGGNNVYVVVVTATAGTRTVFQTVTVTVTNVDDNAPVFAAGSAAHNVVEGQTAVATVIATDGDGDTITYELTSGADQGDFEITDTGDLAFRTAPDFENPGSADNSNVYVVVVTATAGGQAVTQVVTVTVTNVDDNAPVFAEGSASHTVAEGQTVVATVIAADGDGDTITYTLTGADQGDFEITDTGVLAFNTAPDFENPTDAGGNNVYVVVVAATSGTRTAFQTVTALSLTWTTMLQYWQEAQPTLFLKVKPS